MSVADLDVRLRVDHVGLADGTVLTKRGEWASAGVRPIEGDLVSLEGHE